MLVFVRAKITEKSGNTNGLGGRRACKPLYFLDFSTFLGIRASAGDQARDHPNGPAEAFPFGPFERVGECIALLCRYRRRIVGMRPDHAPLNVHDTISFVELV